MSNLRPLLSDTLAKLFATQGLLVLLVVSCLRDSVILSEMHGNGAAAGSSATMNEVEDDHKTAAKDTSTKNKKTSDNGRPPAGSRIRAVLAISLPGASSPQAVRSSFSAIFVYCGYL